MASEAARAMSGLYGTVSFPFLSSGGVRLKAQRHGHPERPQPPERAARAARASELRTLGPAAGAQGEDQLAMLTTQDGREAPAMPGTAGAAKKLHFRKAFGRLFGVELDRNGISIIKT